MDVQNNLSFFSEKSVFEHIQNAQTILNTVDSRYLDLAYLE